MKYPQLSMILAFLILQCACFLALPGSVHSHPGKSSQPAKPRKKANTGPAYDSYFNEVRKQWAHNNYEWLENEAKQLRVSKERLPGGYWKLHVLYRAIEGLAEEASSDEVYQQEIARLDKWVAQHPTSVMSRIILADVWRSYAWYERGERFADKVKPESWPIFNERLQKTNKILTEALSLQEKCPEWYLTALLTTLGQGVDREEYERIFAEAVALEPHYYYLHQAKVIYLQPRWYGEPGEWESFAESIADKVGGEQGDIILFTIYSDRMANSGLDFMNAYQTVAPRLLAGFKAIEKLYGSSPQRLNEACRMSFATNDKMMPAELMDRIGNDYDLTVWKDLANFYGYQQTALERSRQLPR